MCTPWASDSVVPASDWVGFWKASFGMTEEHLFVVAEE
jgi:hypothetical protein